MASLDRTITTGELDYLYDVETAHDRMETLIEDLLALAQSGRQIDEIESVELGDIAKKCWTVIDAGTATLDVSECQSLIIEADRKRLRQLLENLYRNAIEHGGEDVTISVGVLPDETGFYVEDDGTGIPPESLERLVEPGYSTREDGSGLGLTIVADVVRAHGWELVVTDSERGGARFEIRTSAIDTSTVGSNRHAVHPSTASSDEN